MNTTEFERLQERVRSAKTNAERAQGARDEALRRLRAEFSVASVDAARAKLKEMQAELRALEKSLAAKIKAFDQAWPHE
jgi:chromosome segregation ATPase